MIMKTLIGNMTLVVVDRKEAIEEVVAVVAVVETEPILIGELLVFVECAKLLMLFHATIAFCVVEWIIDNMIANLITIKKTK